MSDLAQDLLHRAEACLKAARKALSEEIASYPTPISGCDAQFNHLLAERRRANAGLSALGKQVFVPTPRKPDAAARVESR